MEFSPALTLEQSFAITEKITDPKKLFLRKNSAFSRALDYLIARAMAGEIESREQETRLKIEFCIENEEAPEVNTNGEFFVELLEQGKVEINDFMASVFCATYMRDEGPETITLSAETTSPQRVIVTRKLLNNPSLFAKVISDALKESIANRNLPASGMRLLITDINGEILTGDIAFHPLGGQILQTKPVSEVYYKEFTKNSLEQFEKRMKNNRYLVFHITFLDPCKVSEWVPIDKHSFIQKFGHQVMISYMSAIMPDTTLELKMEIMDSDNGTIIATETITFITTSETIRMENNGSSVEIPIAELGISGIFELPSQLCQNIMSRANHDIAFRVHPKLSENGSSFSP